MLLRAVVVLLLVSLVGCSKDNHTVADVDGERITDAQFIERYRQYLASTSQRDNILVRQQVLNNMINETLVYRDLSRRGLDRDEAYRTTVEDLTSQALLLAYARTIVSDTSSIPEHELYQEFRAYNSKVTARYLYAKSESGARALKTRIERGATFEELARDVFADPGLANNGGSLGTFGWGEMEPALEGVAFSIREGTISDPVRMSMGYAIVRVDRRVENQFVTEGDYLKVREKLWRRVLERKFQDLIKGELQRIEKELAPSFNDNAVREVFANWKVLMDEASPAPPGEHGTVETANLSSMELVRFNAGRWSVGDFLKRLAKTTERQKGRVKKEEDVRGVAIGLATREVLLNKARHMGLASDPAVVNEVRHGREAFLLKRWASEITDSVGSSGWDEQMLRKTFEQTKAGRVYPPEVNVAEILLRTEKEARQLVEKLRRGADFGVLARKYSIRLWAAKNNGELGFGTEGYFGPMGRKFFSARVGEIIGPEKVDPYFGIFKILERQDGRAMTFDEARGQIIEEMRQTRQMDARKNALEHLRQGVSVSINNDLLSTIVLN